MSISSGSYISLTRAVMFSSRHVFNKRQITKSPRRVHYRRCKRMSYKAKRARIHFTPRFTLTLNLLSFRRDPVEIGARIPRIVARYLELFLTRVPLTSRRPSNGQLHRFNILACWKWSRVVLLPDFYNSSTLINGCSSPSTK